MDHKPRRVRRALVDAVRRSMFIDLKYEIDQLLYSAVRLTMGPLLENDAVKNAVLESLLIHARVMTDFFYQENPREDDLVAADYFKDASQWEAVCPPRTPIHDEIRDDVNKRLAHLTIVRTLKKDHDPRRIAAAILPPLHMFLNSVPSGTFPEENLVEWQEELLAPAIRWLEVEGFLVVDRGQGG